MKLIIKHYLASLKERGELDAILPDLLSQMGLTVFSSPGLGTRQYGVDVAAVGSIKKGEDKVYLFSVKAGNLDRKTWSSNSAQSLRSSLDEIQDVYIPNNLPHEHRTKPIVICLCVGGEIQEAVRMSVQGYINKYQNKNLQFEEWNGDLLADKILSNFLNENLLPLKHKSLLRKSLALLDEPEASFKHFSDLVKSLSNIEPKSSNKTRLIKIRQLSICLWILFAWARDIGNLESAYLSAELVLLHAWELVKNSLNPKNKLCIAIRASFVTILKEYQTICEQFLVNKILPHTNKPHALSFAVHAFCSVDVNLKLFDILGRIAMLDIWHHWLSIENGNYNEKNKEHNKKGNTISQLIKNFINNNPSLLLPLKDDHAIDISLVLLLLSFNAANTLFIKTWLNEIMQRAVFSYTTHGNYPCILQSYSELIEQSKNMDDTYRKKTTESSILYPTIAFWAAILDDDMLFNNVKAMKEEHLKHCSFQLWYPDETSENHIYLSNKIHGDALLDISVSGSMRQFLDFIQNECEQTEHFEQLSAYKNGFWPLILVACRHHRIPMPMHFALRKNKK